MSEVDSVGLFVHSITMGIGILAALFLAYAYLKKAPKAYSLVFGSLVFATLAFSGVHLFEDAALFFDELEPYEFLVEHALPLAAFLAIGLGAWNLYSSKEY